MYVMVALGINLRSMVLNLITLGNSVVHVIFLFLSKFGLSLLGLPLIISWSGLFLFLQVFTISIQSSTKFLLKPDLMHFCFSSSRLCW